MTFSLLQPLGLLLAGAVALPLLAHLTRQRPQLRVAFGALYLLERVARRTRRRRTLRDQLLLALRVAALLALALAGAAPEVRYPGIPAEFGASGHVVLLVDRSLSMSLVDGGGTLLQRARSAAEASLERVAPGIPVSLVVFDQKPEILLDREVAHERVRERLAGLATTYEGSDLRGGLHEVRRLLGKERGEVLIFTDEAGPGVVRAAADEVGFLLGAGAVVLPLPVHADPPRNLAVHSATYGDGVEGGEVRFRLTNYGPEPRELLCKATLPDGAVVSVFADVPGGGEVQEAFTVPREADGGVGEVACDDGELPGDDRTYFHLPSLGASRVLVIDGDPGETPTRSEVYFLERALAPWGGSGLTVDVSTPQGLLDLDVEQHGLVVVSNVADLRAGAPRLVDFVRRGGAALITLGENVSPELYNAALGDLLPARLRAARSLADLGEAGVPLVPPDTGLPLFEPFGRGGRASFGQVGVRRLMTLEPFDRSHSTVLLQTETGLPVLLEHEVGTGRVMLLTTTVDLGWTDLPLQAAFMPLVQQLARHLGAVAPDAALRLEGRVGEVIQVPLSDPTADLRVFASDGSELPVRLQGGSLTFVPRAPGPYRVAPPDRPPVAWVAVGTDPAESDVRRSEGLAAVERELDPLLLSRTLDLTPPLLGLAGLLLLTQALLLGGRREEEVDA